MTHTPQHILHLGASSPGLNYLRSVGKLQALGQCQLGHSFANMTGHPALRDQIVFKGKETGWL